MLCVCGCVDNKTKAKSSTLLRCLVGGAKSSLDFRRLSFNIIRAAAKAILVDVFLARLLAVFLSV